MVIKPEKPKLNLNNKQNRGVYTLEASSLFQFYFDFPIKHFQNDGILHGWDANSFWCIGLYRNVCVCMYASVSKASDVIM